MCAGSAGHGEEGRQRGEVERRRRRVKVGEERRPTHMTEVLLVRTGSVVTGRQWVKALFYLIRRERHQHGDPLIREHGAEIALHGPITVAMEQNGTTNGRQNEWEP